ncbi:N-6 DNA methylase [Amycolatopsis sp. NPDC000673]
MPTQLFRSTGIPVCVWFFAKDKGTAATWLGACRTGGWNFSAAPTTR